MKKIENNTQPKVVVVELKSDLIAPFRQALETLPPVKDDFPPSKHYKETFIPPCK